MTLSVPIPGIPTIPSLPQIGMKPINGSLTGEKNSASSDSFLSTIQQALGTVSSAQQTAQADQAGYAAGNPGFSMAKVLAASDSASVDFTAMVSVRNEVVSAYQTLMNMQF